MVETSIRKLKFLCDTIPSLMMQIPEVEFSSKPIPAKWSKKEIVGHLIDSATNNHQRFVRAQFEQKPTISYNQNEWNKFNFYNQIDSTQLINFWTVYNKHLLTIIKLIPKESMIKECNTGQNNITLEFLFDDYVNHLEHHLNQIIKY